ncbi:LysR family transcriptional regulator [Companilactobacillus mishanensis]|uniref:LysR family transcriptional regulator n=1 Tax=Companilactobacillus mishanensis TaxID=2486008 RepID=A0ABW9P4L9_9LACO|nr:LysR family transcriptional regulator [Companilactobacillus mishanensis]MQS44131.1 LysR family transcriptional regulator [Companilactobacillus mishanensis]
MNIRDLQYFTKLNELKSFSDTANYFGVSQPTISYSLKRLEKEYETELIVRKSYANSVTLTVFGEQLMKHAHRILREDNLMRKDIDRLKTKKLKVGFPPIISDYLVPQAFDKLKTSGMLDRIEPISAGSKELLDQLYDGDLDISLLGASYLPHENDFDYEVIKKQNFKIIASDKREFPKTLHLKDLINEDAILLDENSMHRQIVDNLVDKYNVFTNVVYQTADYRLLLDLVRANKGISLITETALVNAPGVKELNVIDTKFPPFYIMIIYRHTLQKGPLMNKLIEIFSKL